MSTSQLTLMINKSLHDIDKISEQNDEKNTISYDDFRVLHANAAIKTLSHDEKKSDIEGPLITHIDDKYKKRIEKAIADEDGPVPFIDYRLVIKGLKKSSIMPIEFVDRNEQSKPKWCRMDQLILNVPQKEPLNGKTDRTSVIEIEDDMKKLNISSISCLSIDDSFWNDIKVPYMNEIEPIYPSCDEEPSMQTNKTWTEVNLLSLTIHANQIKENLQNQCAWMILFDLLKAKRELKKDVSREEAKEALKKLIVSYKKPLLFQKSIFSIRTAPSHYKNSVRSVVELHHEHRRTSKNPNDQCDACKDAIDNGLMKQAIMACAIVIQRYDHIKYKPPAHSDKYLKSNLSYIKPQEYSLK
jgi:hypothetical protein